MKLSFDLKFLLILLHKEKNNYHKSLNKFTRLYQRSPFQYKMQYTKSSDKLLKYVVSISFTCLR